MDNPVRSSVSYAEAIATSPRLTAASVFPEVNRTLFDGRLPGCTICNDNLNNRNHLGQAVFSSPPRIVLNVETFSFRSYEGVMSTFVHELCHVYEYLYGPKGAYHLHTPYWTALMEARGLMPSHTGAPGGRENGEQMTHYVIRGGRFEALVRKLLEPPPQVITRTFAPVLERRFQQTVP